MSYYTDLSACVCEAFFILDEIVESTGEPDAGNPLVQFGWSANSMALPYRNWRRSAYPRQGHRHVQLAASKALALRLTQPTLKRKRLVSRPLSQSPSRVRPRAIANSKPSRLTKGCHKQTRKTQKQRDRQRLRLSRRVRSRPARRGTMTICRTKNRRIHAQGGWMSVRHN